MNKNISRKKTVTKTLTKNVYILKKFFEETNQVKEERIISYWPLTEKEAKKMVEHSDSNATFISLKIDEIYRETIRVSIEDFLKLERISVGVKKVAGEENA